MGRIARDAVATWIIASVAALAAIAFGGPLLLKLLGGLFAMMDGIGG